MTEGAYQLHNDKQIAVISQLLVDGLLRVRRFGNQQDYNGVIISLALGWGRATGRPLDISTVANIVQLPRTTVKRILDRLVASGDFTSAMDGRRRVYFRKEESLRGVNAAALELLMIEQQAHIRKAARLLSEMDSNTRRATEKSVIKS